MDVPPLASDGRIFGNNAEGCRLGERARSAAGGGMLDSHHAIPAEA
jgi:hypothetical protein